MLANIIDEEYKGKKKTIMEINMNTKKKNEKERKNNGQGKWKN